jgi:hypothetical protein
LLSALTAALLPTLTRLLLSGLLTAALLAATTLATLSGLLILLATLATLATLLSRIFVCHWNWTPVCEEVSPI